MCGSIRCSPLGEHDKIKGKITFTINQKFLIYALLGFYPKMKVSKKREEAFSMPFTPRQTKGREKSFYKTLYLSEQLIREVIDPLPGILSCSCNMILSRIKDIKGLRL